MGRRPGGFNDDAYGEYERQHPCDIKDDRRKSDVAGAVPSGGDQVKEKVPQIDLYSTGQNIKRIMQMKGMTVKEVSEYLELAAVQSVYHWFAGRCLPTVDNLYALSELFCVPMDVLVCQRKGKEFYFCCHPTYWRFMMYHKKCQEIKAENSVNFIPRRHSWPVA